MKTFIVTMGQDHVHRLNNITIDKDIVVEITAENELAARAKAFDAFGQKWSFIYPEEDFMARGNMKYFPRGSVKLEDHT